MSDMELGTQDLFAIGGFARMTGLMVKALRHYDDIGLLRPARVDDDTGYRYYTLEQTRAAEAIRRLRSLDVPLEDVRAMLGADPESLRERLAAHRARVEGRAVETRRILTELGQLIEGKQPLVPEPDEVTGEFGLDVKDVAAQTVAVVRERAHVDDVGSVIPRQIADVAAFLRKAGVSRTGPPFTVCPFPDDEGVSELETGWPVSPEVPARPPVEVKTYPAARALVMKHVGPYQELSRSYRVMAEMMERDGLHAAGDPREIYWTDPDEVPDPNDYVTELVWPVTADERRWRTPGRSP